MTAGAFYIRPEDMLKIGQLVSNKGYWEGKALISSNGSLNRLLLGCPSRITTLSCKLPGAPPQNHATVTMAIAGTGEKSKQRSGNMMPFLHRETEDNIFSLLKN